jgi:hypothetical protein
MRARSPLVTLPVRLTACVAAALVAGGAQAQQPAAASPGALDVRWQAFTGCWVPAVDAAAGEPLPAGDPVRCVVPVGASAVDVVSIADGRVTARERLDASGAAVTRAADGCTGTTTARWSDDGRRLYTRTQATCGDAAGRRGSGILALGEGWQLIDARGVAAAVPGVPLGVRVTRWRAAERVPAALDAADRAALGAASERAVEDGRLVAAAPIGVGTVPELVQAVDPEVAEAWLAARGQGFARLDARRLQLLAAQGVPSTTLDLLVALSYPRTFAINPRTLAPSERPPQVAARSADPRARGTWGYADPFWGWSGLGVPGLAWGPGFGFNRLGFANGWGSAFGNPWGWNSWGAPVVIVNRPPANDGGAPGARRTARPRDNTSSGGAWSDGGSRSAGAIGGSSSGGGSASGGGSSSSGGSSSGGGSGGGGRTARPRP